MNDFCTLFDVNYLSRALVMYRSLAEHCPEFRLRAVCMDEPSLNILGQLGLPNLEVVGLRDIERHDAGLLEVKPTRSAVDYFWTSTAPICLYFLETQPELEAITYLDADLMFWHDPRPIFDELGERSILLVPHRYAPEWRHHEARFGTYNVQFMTFRRNDEGLAALRWWRERCLEWCYARAEDGKFGDQKYLDQWPERFAGVHILEHPGGGLAPWNVGRHSLEERGGDVVVDGRPLIFFHYHSLRLYRGLTTVRRAGFLADLFHYTPRPTPLVWDSDYASSPRERRLIWDPYLERLGTEIRTVDALGAPRAAGFKQVKARSVAYELARDLGRRARSRRSRVSRERR